MHNIIHRIKLSRKISFTFIPYSLAGCVCAVSRLHDAACHSHGYLSLFAGIFCLTVTSDRTPFVLRPSPSSTGSYTLAVHSRGIAYDCMPSRTAEQLGLSAVFAWCNPLLHAVVYDTIGHCTSSGTGKHILTARSLRRLVVHLLEMQCFSPIRPPAGMIISVTMGCHM